MTPWSLVEILRREALMTSQAHDANRRESAGADPATVGPRPLGPEAGETRDDLTPEEFLDALRQLKRETDKRAAVCELPWRPARL
jgi:hypothetical protein